MPRFIPASRLAQISLLLVAATCLVPRHAEAESTEFFLLWGMNGHWDGELRITDGTFQEVLPYSFETPPSDLYLGADTSSVRWESGVRNGFDGLHVTANMTDNTRLLWSTEKGERELTLADFPATGERVIRLPGKTDCLILGRGDPARGPGPLREKAMPPRFVTPTPGHIVPLPENWHEQDRPVLVRLSKKQSGTLTARRVAASDGRLLVQLLGTTGALQGSAEVRFGRETKRVEDLQDGLWLSLTPRIGRLSIQVELPDAEQPQELTVPTTLVEVRGTQLFVNGEPLLIKGTLPRNMNAEDAAYLRRMGVNTIRGKEADTDGQQYEFFVIDSAHGGPGHLVTQENSPTEKKFQENMGRYLKAMAEPVAQAAASPYTIVVQVANEQAYGNDTWGRHLAGIRQFERLDRLLVGAYNLVKRLDPMLPVGYANHAIGYVAPSFLDVYMHNSFMDQDRYHVPIDEYMELQGCASGTPDSALSEEIERPAGVDQRSPSGSSNRLAAQPPRPFISTEWGANVYTPQVYHAGPNHPVLEKLHAWNYPNRWATYLEAGAIGGTSYCMYDLPSATDQGTSRFGLLTYDRKPKLACWDAWHMWRDLEVTPQQDGCLHIAYGRDYWARDCRLSIQTEEGTSELSLDDFRPNESRVVRVPHGDVFHWTMDFTTHGGLPMQAVGAHPLVIEQQEFVDSLKGRETYGMLKELFDTEVITVDGRPAPRTLAQMTRDDGVIPIGLRKPDGTVYLALITREPPAEGPYREDVEVELPMRGTVEAVDSTTGLPLDTQVEVELLPNGLRLTGLRAARIPGPIGRRSDVPLELPLWRITPTE